MLFSKQNTVWMKFERGKGKESVQLKDRKITGDRMYKAIPSRFKAEGKDEASG